MDMRCEPVVVNPPEGPARLGFEARDPGSGADVPCSMGRFSIFKSHFSIINLLEARADFPYFKESRNRTTALNSSADAP